MKQVAVIGASGYTGAELIRLLLQHPHVQISTLVAESNAGKEMAEIYPHLAMAGLPTLVKLDAVDFSDIDIVFCCLPHATGQRIIKDLPEHLKVIDLSADFRLRDPALYEEWYNTAHIATELQKEAVYGLTEHAYDALKEARIVACPGCYPTSMLLPLLPLLDAEMIDPNHIIVDAKSGMTGAGRNARVPNLYTEMNENIKAYSIGRHRHTAEVEQELSHVAGADIAISFTPHVVAMNRGILSCIYVTLNEGITADDLQQALRARYKDAAFVHVLEDNMGPPTTRDVLSTNQCRIKVCEDRVPGKAVIVSVIDNLVKGASGQAVQNMNVMHGWEETIGLAASAI